MNGVTHKELVDKYKKELEKMCWVQGVVLDRVVELENRISEMETTNTQLSETNTSLTKINEQLTNECTVEDGKIESLNEALAQAHQEASKLKEEVEQRKKENDFVVIAKVSTRPKK